jgi:hypothetical protein
MWTSFDTWIVVVGSLCAVVGFAAWVVGKIGGAW